MSSTATASSGFSVFRFAAPHVFYPLAGRMVPWFGALAAVLAIAGLYVGFFVAPTDFQQGESYR
ncbi:MAG: heme ABC transporter permease, partial [Burkholderiaceae bacterium]|nr:heme ABC transporter permease [Burkholderiaceae bacterium]